MGRNKSKTQRLPPSERTLVGSKIISSQQANSSNSSNVPTTLQLEEVRHKKRVVVPRGAKSRPFSKLTAQLDDDSLRKVLRCAGPLAILTASRVCRRWRRVALSELVETTSLDVASAIRRNRNNSIFSYRSVLHMIESFPSLKVLSLRKFPYTEILPEVAPYLMTHLRMPTINGVDFSGFEFSPTDLTTLLTGCPALQQLTVSQCPGLSKVFTTELANALERNAQLSLGSAASSLKIVDVSGCGGVNDEALIPLLCRGLVDEIRARSCINIRRIDFKNSLKPTSTILNLHHCRNLTRIQMNSGALIDINLSQCASLTKVHLSPPQPGASHSIRVLNLASCTMLRDISFAVVGAQTGGSLPPIPLQNLEELLLFQSRSLPAAVISRAFGMARISCSLPKLRRLELIGTQIEELRLRGYTCLESVDVSGCTYLNVVDVADSWKIERFNLRSAKAPLARVSMVLPCKTLVLGLRANWTWQSTEALQMIEFGT